MRPGWPLVGALALLLLAGCATVGRSADQAVIHAKNEVAPALVHVRPVKEVFSQGRSRQVVVQGSGFIISPDGYVVTNHHVAGDSTRVYCVLHNKDQVEAQVVGTDAVTDLAVLKLDTDFPLPFARMGASSTLESGQTVLALGSPHGLARSVSKGIVSVPEQFLPDGGGAETPHTNWIQTDAAINQGNSGGPLVNLRGEVVGINTRKLLGADNVGFAIPIDIAKDVIAQLRERGAVHRSWLGLGLQETMSLTGNPEQKGVLVASIAPFSPASETNLQPGDILLAVNGIETNARFEEELPQVRQRIAGLPIGEEAVLTIDRDGSRIEYSIETVEYSEVRGNQMEFDEWGFSAIELTPVLARRVLLERPRGILVTGSEPGSPAGDAGLSAGDVVLKVDSEAVEDLAHFAGLYQERVASGQSRVLLDVKRGALTRYVLIEQINTGHEQGGSTQDGGGSSVQDLDAGL